MFAGLALLVVGLVLTIIIVEFGVPWAIVKIANVDSWWSPWRTKAPPGEMYILVRGDPSGPFDSVIESVLNWFYNDKSQMFEEEKMAKPEDSYLDKLGVVYVGFFRYILWREVTYDKWERLPNSTEWGLRGKTRGVKGEKDQSPSIYFQYNMATKVEGAETIGNFPVDAIILFTARVVSPVKAFFFAGSWSSQVNAAVQGVFREYVGKKTIDKLREEQAGGAKSLVELIKGLSIDLLDLFGIEIIDAKFVSFDLVGGDQAMTDAVRAVEIATLQANAAEKRGEGEKRERIARAAGVEAEVKAWGSDPVGATLAMAEAIKIAKPAAIGGNILASVDIGSRGGESSKKKSDDK